MYLDLLEDEVIPDAVFPHDTFPQLSFLPTVGELQQPALQRGVRLPKDLQRRTRGLTRTASPRFNRFTYEHIKSPPHLIINSVEESRNSRKKSGFQGVQIVRQPPNVPLKKADSAPVQQHASLSDERKA